MNHKERRRFQRQLNHLNEYLLAARDTVDLIKEAGVCDYSGLDSLYVAVAESRRWTADLYDWLHDEQVKALLEIAVNGKIQRRDTKWLAKVSP